MYCKIFGICVALLLLTTAACRTVLHSERDWDIAPGETKSLIVEPAPRDQTVKVEVTVTGGTVNVYACLESDRKEVERDAETRKVPAKALKYELKTSGVTLEVPVPANTEAAVVVTGATKAVKVKLKVTN
jgi:hypothetical protein